MRQLVFTGYLIGSIIASAILVLVGLIFKIDLDYYLTLIGTVVTALAFGFGTYFVVIAIEAYSQLQAIRVNAEKVETAASSIKFKEAQVDGIQKGLVSIQTDVSHFSEKLHQSAEKILQVVVQYALATPAQTKKGEQARAKFIQQAHCIRYRFILEGQFNNTEKRMAVLALQQYGDLEALPLIKSLCSQTADVTLRQVCDVAINAITEMHKK
jgi:hypothetical protein